MMRIRWDILAVTSWLASGVAALPASSVSTETFAANTVTINGAGTSPLRDTWFGLSVVKPFVWAGLVTASGSNTVSDCEASWQPGQFNGTNGSFYIEFVDPENPNSPASGLMADIVETDGLTQTLTLRDDVRALISVGQTRYRIRPHFTFFDVFGATNEAGLKKGANAGQADTIELQLQDNILSIFYWSYSGPVLSANGWYRLPFVGEATRDGYVPLTNFVIYPEQGIRVLRRAPGDVHLVIQGQIKNTPTKVPIYPGNNTITTVKTFKSLRLADLNLYTGDPQTGIMSGLNAGLADTLEIIEPEGVKKFFFFEYGNFKYWVRPADNSYIPSNDYLIPPGSAFIIYRKAPDMFTWQIPAE